MIESIKQFEMLIHLTREKQLSFLKQRDLHNALLNVLNIFNNNNTFKICNINVSNCMYVYKKCYTFIHLKNEILRNFHSLKSSVIPRNLELIHLNTFYI